MTVTIGLLILLNGARRLDLEGRAADAREPVPDDTSRHRRRRDRRQDLGIIGVCLAIVLVLWAFFQRTRVGLALRAAALNPESSRLHGVRVSWMLALGWGLAAVLGAVAGILVAPTQGSFDQNLMLPVLIFAFAAAVLGGLDSPIGAVVGGVVLGVVLNLVGAYIDFFADLRLPVALC